MQGRPLRGREITGSLKAPLLLRPARPRIDSPWSRNHGFIEGLRSCPTSGEVARLSVVERPRVHRSGIKHTHWLETHDRSPPSRDRGFIEGVPAWRTSPMAVDSLRGRETTGSLKDEFLLLRARSVGTSPWSRDHGFIEGSIARRKCGSGTRLSAVERSRVH